MVADAMPRRKVLRQVVLGMILLLVLVLLWRQYKSAHLRVAYSDYCRVERGMSRAEVESVSNRFRCGSVHFLATISLPELLP